MIRFSPDVYFWSQFEEEDKDDDGVYRVEKTFPYRNVYTIKMTRGEGEDSGYATQTEAQAHRGETTFSVKIDGTVVVGGAETEMEVKQGATTEWHLLQDFVLPYSLQQGQTYLIHGKTTVDGNTIHE